LADLITFPLTPREPTNNKHSARGKAEITTFPYSRRRQLVEKHARAMRKLSRADSEAYLEIELLKVCEELNELGLDCDCEADALLEFAEAIGRALHGPDFVLRVEGDAS
jgi:hypothetical protein